MSKCKHYSKCNNEGITVFNSKGVFTICKYHIREWNNGYYIQRPKHLHLQKLPNGDIPI